MLWLVVVFYYYLKTLGKVHYFGSVSSIGTRSCSLHGQVTKLSLYISSGEAITGQASRRSAFRLLQATVFGGCFWVRANKIPEARSGCNRIVIAAPLQQSPNISKLRRVGHGHGRRTVGLRHLSTSAATTTAKQTMDPRLSYPNPICSHVPWG
jgi:hypothetical protein